MSLEGTVLGRCCPWRVLSMESTVIGKCCPLKVLSFEDTVPGGYCTWRILSLEGAVLGRCCPWRVLSLRGTVLEGYCSWTVRSPKSLFLECTEGNPDDAAHDVIHAFRLTRRSNCTPSNSTHTFILCSHTNILTALTEGSQSVSQSHDCWLRHCHWSNVR
jgi:hypothetical protein